MKKAVLSHSVFTWASRRLASILQLFTQNGNLFDMGSDSLAPSPFSIFTESGLLCIKRLLPAIVKMLVGFHLELPELNSPLHLPVGRPQFPSSTNVVSTSSQQAAIKRNEKDKLFGAGDRDQGAAERAREVGRRWGCRPESQHTEWPRRRTNQVRHVVGSFHAS